MKQFFTLILIFCSLSLCAQIEAIEKAEKLIENKKYESAFKVLDEADPTNEVPEIVISKSELLIKYFASSMMHQMFALTDLEPDQDIEEVRGTDGTFSMFSFQADSLILRLIKKYPENYNLHKALGFYYHEIHLLYPQNWLLSDSLVIDNFYKNYMAAYDHDLYDNWSLYAIGYYHLINEDFTNAIKFLKKSIELYKEYPSTFYNLAYAYLYNEQREESIEYAKKAMDLYEYPEYKADAARMIAVIHTELNQNEKAHEYYEISNNIHPNNYYTLKPLLETKMTLNKDSYKILTEEFFLLGPSNPTIYEDLLFIYFEHEKSNELIDFLKNQQDKFAEDNLVSGNLYLYIAVIQYESKKFDQAKINFKQSKEIFKNVFEENHEVFSLIDSFLEKM